MLPVSETYHYILMRSLQRATASECKEQELDVNNPEHHKHKVHANGCITHFSPKTVNAAFNVMYRMGLLDASTASDRRFEYSYNAYTFMDSMSAHTTWYPSDLHFNCMRFAFFERMQYASCAVLNDLQVRLVLESQESIK